GRRRRGPLGARARRLLQGPLSRARRHALRARRHRPGAAQHRRPAAARRRAGGQGSDPGHRRHGRRPDHRPLHRRPLGRIERDDLASRPRRSRRRRARLSRRRHAHGGPESPPPRGRESMMVRLRAFLLLASAVVCAGFRPAYAADVTDAQKSAMCQTRKTCAIAPSLHNAGSSAAGPLSVAELHFGLAGKPDDAPDEGCIAGDYETRDGGVEYWLLEGSEPPRLLLRLCNDGYGAAGVGEDEVTVAENRFVHRQYGGSASRWEETTTET